MNTSEDRVKALIDMTERAVEKIKELSKIVQRDHSNPSSDDFKIAEKSTRVIVDIRAAVADILETPTTESVSEEKGYGGQERVEKHESFGCIQANRVSGNADLFGSMVDHHYHFIRLTITRASAIFRRLDSEMTTWPDNSYAGHIVEINMSAAQWAELITTMNMGMGTPCTLHRVRGRQMDPVPRFHENRSTRILEDYRREMKNAPKESQEAYEKLIEVVDSISMPKGKKAEIHEHARKMVANYSQGVNFVFKQFNEAAEKHVTAVKTEIDNAVSFAAMKLGIQQIRDTGVMPALESDPKQLPLLPESVDGPRLRMKKDQP